MAAKESIPKKSGTPHRKANECRRRRIAVRGVGDGLAGRRTGRSTGNGQLLRTLQEIFDHLSIIGDVQIVCAQAYRATEAEQDGEVASVLRRCGSDRLFTQLERLSRVIEGLGGKTRLTSTAGEHE